MDKVPGTVGDALATWVVQISTQGLEAMQAASEAVRAKLEGIDAATQSTVNDMSRAFSGAAGRISDAFATLTAPQTINVGYSVPSKAPTYPGSQGATAGPASGSQGPSDRGSPATQQQQPAPADTGSPATQKQQPAPVDSGPKNQTPAPAPSSMSQPTARGPGGGGIDTRAFAQAAAPTEGMDNLTAAILKIPPALEQVAKAFQGEASAAQKGQGGVSRAITTTTRQAEDSAKRIGNTQLVLGAGYAFLTSKLMGYVNAGMAGTMEGNRLSFVFQQLSRQIASVFTPLIHATIEQVGRLVDWFRSLSGTGQQMAGQIALVSVALLGVTTVVSPLIGKIASVGTALTTAFAAHPILAVVAAIVALLVSTEQGRAAISKLVDAFAPIGTALADTFASVLDGLSPALEAVAGLIGTIAEALKPVFEAFAPILKIVGEIEGLMAGALAPVITLIAEAVTAVLVPAFELLKPIVEGIGADLKTLSGAISGLLGLGSSRPKNDEKKPRQELTPAGGGYAASAQAARDQLQESILRSDFAREQRDRQIQLLESINRNTQNQPFKGVTPAVAA